MATSASYNLASGALAPYIGSIDKGCIDPSSTIRVIIEGDNFDTSTTFSSTGATFSNYNYIDGNTIEVDVTVGAAGSYDVVANNGSLNSTGYTPNNGVALLNVTPTITLIPGDGTTNWANVTAGVTTGLGSIAGNNASGWNKQGTFGSVAAGSDAILKFTFAGYGTGGTISGYGMIGFGVDPTANTSYNTIDHSAYIQNFNGTSANLYVYENGASRGLLSTIAVGDVIEIKRTGGVVTYHKNGTLFFTSPTPSTGVLHFDSSIYRNITLNSISLEGC